MYSIKEVSEVFQINANKLRFYEKKELIKPQRNEQSGYREYSQNDLMAIQLILTYRALDIPVVDIKRVMKDLQNVTIEDQLFKQLKMVNSKIHQYRAIQSGLEDIMNIFLEDSSIENLKQKFIELGSRIKLDNVKSTNWIDMWDFDTLADSYDELIVDVLNQPIFYKNYEILLKKVYDLATQNLIRNATILDIGVGTGNLAGLFLEDEITVVGLDQSVKMMFEAKRKYPDLKLKYGEFLKLPFEDERFDRIVSTYAFHHLTSEEKELALNEMSRVLKKDGEIIIGDIMIEDDEIRQELINQDEYYTVISDFVKVANRHNFNVQVISIDEFLYILKIRIKESTV